MKFAGAAKTIRLRCIETVPTILSGQARRAECISLRRAAEIKAIGIGKTFGAFRALNDLSLDIGRGEFLTLLGPSGSGKTTFLMILAGFVPPSDGTAAQRRHRHHRQPAEQRSSGMVFQGYALFPAYDRRSQHRLSAEGAQDGRPPTSASASAR